MWRTHPFRECGRQQHRFNRRREEQTLNSRAFIVCAGMVAEIVDGVVGDGDGGDSVDSRDDGFESPSAAGRNNGRNVTSNAGTNPPPKQSPFVRSILVVTRDEQRSPRSLCTSG
jgi:hypothetical protein